MRQAIGWTAAALCLAVCAAIPAPARAAARRMLPSITADFSGGGSPETITATAKGRAVRLEARDASGKRIARAEAPAPESGRFDVALSAGSIGSAGALLEVKASGGDTVCRSIWRLRDGALSRLPLRDGAETLPDCDTGAPATSRWDESHNEPARYLRESTRDVAQGRLRESLAYVFVGFEMKRDPKKSSSEINGVPIPLWTDVTLYSRKELEGLVQRFDLSGLARTPRLRIETDRDRGVFLLVAADPAGERRFPITGSRPVEVEDRRGLELAAGDGPMRVTVTPADGSAPQTAVVRGAGAPLDGGYGSVTHFDGQRLQIFATAEQELASQFLPGAWTSDRTARLLVALAPGAAAVRFGDADLSLRLEGAPAGTDLLLAPPGGAPPTFALTLRGPNGFKRTPVRCAEVGGTGRDCRVEGDGEVFRRIGGQVNAR